MALLGEQVERNDSFRRWIQQYVPIRRGSSSVDLASKRKKAASVFFVPVVHPFSAHPIMDATSVNIEETRHLIPGEIGQASQFRERGPGAFQRGVILQIITPGEDRKIPLLSLCGRRGCAET